MKRTKLTLAEIILILVLHFFRLIRAIMHLVYLFVNNVIYFTCCTRLMFSHMSVDDLPRKGVIGSQFFYCILSCCRLYIFRKGHARISETASSR